MSLAEEWDAGGLSTQGGCLSLRAAAGRSQLQFPEHRWALETSLGQRSGRFSVRLDHRGLTEPSIAVLDPETPIPVSLGQMRQSLSRRDNCQMWYRSIESVLSRQSDTAGEARCRLGNSNDGNPTTCGVPFTTQLPCWSRQNQRLTSTIPSQPKTGSSRANNRAARPGRGEEKG